MRLNTGADTMPPVCPAGPCVESVTTMIATGVVRDGAHGGDHLQRRHADLIAHRHRRERAVGPLLRIPDDARALAGKIARHLAAESEARDVPAQTVGADLESDLDGADVARPDDHL